MDFLPLFIRISQRACLVIGGGEIALRKVRLLLSAGANVSVWAPELCANLQQLVIEHREQVRVTTSNFDMASVTLSDYFLVVIASNDTDMNRQIAAACQELGVLCNHAGDVSLGDVSLPAVINREPMVIALHSSGVSPTLTRFMKRQLEAFVPRHFGRLAQWAETWRHSVKQTLPATNVRRLFWDTMLSGLPARLLQAGQTEKADRVFQSQLDKAKKGPFIGEVYLVGAGPGDPELLTLKALRLIQQADVVLYDRLVSDDIMALLPSNCERIYVGKRQSDHALPQEDINQRLADLAQAGRNVLRLKGGDPFIFGRGGEELELLVQAGVSFQVVPGITAASGCASYAGIPLTHRDHSQSVRFITGHLRNHQVNLPWPELALPNQTLVFYMGLKGLPVICETLIQHGRSATTPAAVIEKGTTLEQRVIEGDLSTLAELVEQADLSAPTLLIVGEVVQLRRQLAWLESGFD